MSKRSLSSIRGTRYNEKRLLVVSLLAILMTLAPFIPPVRVAMAKYLRLPYNRITLVSEELRGVALSTDGSTIAVSTSMLLQDSRNGIRFGKIHLFNVWTNELVQTYNNEDSVPNPMVYGVIFSPSPNVLAFSDWKGVKLLHIQRGRPLKLYREIPAVIDTNMVFTPEGTSLFAQGIERGTNNQWLTPLRLWDVASGRVIRTVDNAGRGDAHASNFSLSTDGKRIAYITQKDVGSSKESVKAFNNGRERVFHWREGGNIVVRDVRTNRKLRTFDAMNSQIVGIAPDGRRVAVYEQEHYSKKRQHFYSRVRLLDVDTGATLWKLEQRSFDEKFSVSDLVFSPSGKIFACYGELGSHSQSITLRNSISGEVITTLNMKLWGTNESNVGNLVFSQDGKTLIATSKNTVLFWDVSRWS